MNKIKNSAIIFKSKEIAWTNSEREISILQIIKLLMIYPPIQ